ncbi:hypothetical protein ECCB7326_0110 [Escherichia coli CB7326]|nr:hypothetical protein ECEC4013_0324 [Escherichia coli EC4013]EKI13877.1 hypothetical protein ECCB7326_0110 [Escherichia coli CB7326]EKJ35791.1 hypothetical protein ECEC1868_0260 [Escherichia coli EC1868]
MAPQQSARHAVYQQNDSFAESVNKAQIVMTITHVKTYN